MGHFDKILNIIFTFGVFHAGYVQLLRWLYVLRISLSMTFDSSFCCNVSLAFYNWCEFVSMLGTMKHFFRNNLDIW